MSDNRRVLLVDDDPEVLATYREVLTGRARRHRNRGRQSTPSFELFSVTSGEEAIELVRSELQSGRVFACGVFDMRMPGLDGMDTIREVRRLDPNLLCAVCTAYSDRTIDEIDELFTVAEKDQWDYLQKPIAASELMQKVRCLVSSWNRRRREDRHKTRMATLIGQLSKIATARPGDVERCLDLMIGAVRDLTQSSRGALMEDGPHGMRVVRSWCQNDDEQWLEALTRAGREAAAAVDGLVVYPVPSEGIQRTLFISSPAESDQELLTALGLLLENSARLITLNAELQIMNESLATQCKALASARSQAVQSAKLAAIGQVAAGVANDVNGPLGIIQLETEMVLDALTSESIDADRVQGSALQIQQQVKQITGVVGEVRDFAQKSPDRREAVSLKRAIDSALVILKHRLATESAKIEMDIPEDLPDALADKIQFIQVLVSLITTALDSAGTSDPRIGVRGRISPDRAGMVRIEVSDRESGAVPIPQAPIGLERLQAVGPGTGPWISAVRTIADMHQGYLDLCSSPDGGTTVWIDFPSVVRSRTSGDDPHAQPRVLVLRADQERAQVTAEALRDIGAAPNVAQSYREASEQLGRGEADLVVTDLDAGSTSVWRLLDDLEKSRGAPPVLVVGRGTQTGPTNELKHLGISGQLAEPFDPVAVKTLIFQTLGRAEPSEQVSGRH